MNADNILITGAGGDIGQSVIRCLKEGLPQSRLIGCDVDAYAASRGEVSAFYPAPRATPERAYSTFLRRVISKEKITVLIPTTESEIKTLDRHRGLFPHTRVLIHEPKILRTFLDKGKTIAFFQRHGIACPKTYRLSEYSGGLSYPFLLKQAHGHGGKGLHMIEDARDLEYYRRRFPSSIVQEIVGDADHEYTVGVFSDGKNMESIAFRRYLGYGSLTKYAELVQDEALDALAKKIASAVRLKGSLNVQARKTPRGYLPFEVNPRFSSTVYTRHHFGFQDAVWWVKASAGLPFRYRPKFASGISVRKISEVFFVP